MSNQQVWQNQSPVAPAHGFVARHWRGELSLGKSFLTGFAAAVLLRPMIMFPLDSILESAVPHPSVMQQVAAIYLPAAALALWGAVGTLRAGWRRRYAPKFMQRMMGIGCASLSAIWIIGVAGGLVAFIGAAADHNTPPPRHHVVRQ